MHILCLTSRLPYPPNRGDRLRAFHFIEHLATEHELTLVSFIADEAEREHMAPLRAYCQDVHVVPMSSLRSGLTAAVNAWRSQPLQALYYRSAVMQALIDKLLAENHFDAAYIHLFRMAPYLAKHSSLYRVVDLTDVISNELRRSMPYRSPTSRLVYSVERPRIERYERWVAENFEETWLIADHDRQTLAAVCPGANIQVVRNGVDLDAFHPTDQAETPNSLIFVGHMRVFHNIDAATHLATEILPLVQQEIPGCTLTIVGADPAPEVLALADDPAVTVTGFVDDLNDALNQAPVFAAPLRFAAGVQNKVLEAMAAGRSVVTTSIVNNGLGAQPDQELLVADDVATMAAQIIALLQDPARRSLMGQIARQFVADNYSWQHAVRRMRTIKEMLQARGGK